MQPINYSIDVGNPMQSAVQGFQLGDAMRQREAQRQQQERMAAELAELSTNPTSERVGAFMLRNPGLAEPIKKAWDTLAPERQKSDLATLGKVTASLHNNPADAVQLLRDQSALLKNSGDTAGAKVMEDMARIAEIDPQLAKMQAILTAQAIPGGEKIVQAITALGAEGRAASKAPYEARSAAAAAETAEAGASFAREQQAADLEAKRAGTANVNSQVTDRVARLGMDRDKFTSEVQMRLQEFEAKRGEIPESARKIVNDSAAGAVAAKQASGQMQDLAQRLEKEGGGYGAAAGAAEWFAKATGRQDQMSAMRQEYTRLRNQAAIKSLPPGPATDRDIQLALNGFPSETADAKHIAGFLRGMAKLQDIEAATMTAQAEWANAVGSLGKPKNDITVDGVAVPAGTSYADFSAQYIKRKAADIGKTTAVEPSYMRWAR